MNIAILISGRINKACETYENCIKTFGNNIDFFASFSNNETKENIDKFCSLYKPKKISINEIITFEYSAYMHKKPPETNPNNVISMFYNRSVLFDMFYSYITETNTNYDLIICTRADLIYKSSVDLSEIKKIIDDDFLMIPNPKDDHRGGISDLISIGNINTIGNYLGVFKNIKYLLDTYPLFHPESLLRNHLEYNKCKISRFIMEYNMLR